MLDWSFTTVIASLMLDSQAAILGSFVFPKSLRSNWFHAVMKVSVSGYEPSEPCWRYSRRWTSSTRLATWVPSHRSHPVLLAYSLAGLWIAGPSRYKTPAVYCLLRGMQACWNVR